MKRGIVLLGIVLTVALFSGCKQKPELNMTAAVESGTTNVNVKFDLSKGTLTGVKLFYGKDGKADQEFKGILSSSGVTIKDLEAGVEYLIQLIFVDKDGKKVVIAEKTITTTAKEEPDKKVLLKPVLTGVKVVVDTRKPEWTFKTAENSIGIGEFQCKLNDEDYSTGTINSSGKFIPADNLADGIYTLYVREKDAEGNWSESASFTTEVAVDKRPSPAVSITGSVKSDISGKLLTDQVKPEFVFALSAIYPAEDFAKYVVKFKDSDSWLDVTGDKFVPPVDLANGKFTCYAAAEGKNGVLSNILMFDFYVDLTPPGNFLIKNPASINNSNISTYSCDIITSGEIGEKYSCVVKDSADKTLTFEGFVKSSPESILIKDAASLADGNVTIEIKLIDLFNRETSNPTINAIKDTTNPVLSDSKLYFKALTSDAAKIGWANVSDNISSSDKLQYQLFWSTNDNISNISDVLKNGESVNDWSTGGAYIDVLGSKVTLPVERNFFNVLVKDEAGNISCFAGVDKSYLSGQRGFYSLNSGDSADLSGHGHSITITGNTFGKDRFERDGKAFKIETISSYAQPADSVIHGLKKYTISGWYNVNLSANSQQVCLFSICYWNSSNKFTSDTALELHAGAKSFYWCSNISWNSDYYWNPGVQNFNYNKWHHVVMTRDVKDHRIYVDGVKFEDETNIGNDDIVDSNNGGFVIGQEQDDPAVYPRFEDSQDLNGRVDDFRVYGRALSESEVLKLYNAEKM